MSRAVSASRIAKNRAKAETERKTKRQPHRVDYFHQLNDPYSHLVAQVVADFASRYDIEIVPHLVRASGGRNQPEEEKLAIWARTDCGLIAPHYGLSFPENAGRVPESELQKVAGQVLAGLTAQEFLVRIKDISTALWSGDPSGHLSSSELNAKPQELETALDEGSALLADMNHYSGGTFYYGGEWYWGVDRLFHLEQRLRDLDACRTPTEPYLVPRPSHDLSGVDASGLRLEFFPSLNSPLYFDHL
jgi:2-hydroxychromene-2-carboxylate isomerase